MFAPLQVNESEIISLSLKAFEAIFIIRVSFFVNCLSSVLTVPSCCFEVLLMALGLVEMSTVRLPARITKPMIRIIHFFMALV